MEDAERAMREEQDAGHQERDAAWDNESLRAEARARFGPPT